RSSRCGSRPMRGPPPRISSVAEEATDVRAKETPSTPHVPAWRRRDPGAAAARGDGARADAAAADGGFLRRGAALRRHLASARRGARLLESAAGREGLRLLVH